MEFIGEEFRWVTSEEQPFAQGGNSKVYKVVEKGQPELQHALKFYKLENSEGERYQRFLREIKIVHNLDEIEGCVNLVDYGFHQQKPFYVMHYYPGGTLRTKYFGAERQNTVDLDKFVLGIMNDFQKVLQIVRDLHALQLAVRDIKPQNILMNADGSPVLADFGLSLWVSTPDEQRLTADNIAVGSQGYRAPEWAEAYPDPNHLPGDIWSLGRTLWAMVAGKNPPSSHETLGGKGTHLNAYIPPRYANPLQSILASCGIQNPEQRPDVMDLISHVEDIRKELEQINGNKTGERRSLTEAISGLSLQIKNSEPYIDSTRRDSETAVRLNEIDNAVSLIRDALNLRVEELSGSDLSEFGNFRVHSRNKEPVFSLRAAGLEIDYSQNNLWNHSVTLRFDPSESIAKYQRLSYIYLKFLLGLTDEGEFYWIISSRDQTIPNEYIIEQVKPKSLYRLAMLKTGQLDSLVQKHFLRRLERHFAD